MKLNITKPEVEALQLLYNHIQTKLDREFKTDIEEELAYQIALKDVQSMILKQIYNCL